jgi:flagellar hook-associated protein 3 FlgL
MRISTTMFYKLQASNINNNYSTVNRLQAQISSQKKILQSSDDPTTASAINLTTYALKDLKIYQTNMVLVRNRLNILESSAESASNVMTRVQELLVQAQNDTLNNQDRIRISMELQGHLNNLQTIINTKDNNEYIFSGTNCQTQPYLLTNGQYTYQGSSQNLQVPIDINTSLNYNEVGDQLFANFNPSDLSQNIFDVMQQTIALLQTPVDSSNQANFHDSLSQLSLLMKNADQNITNYISEVGVRSSTVDIIDQQNKNAFINNNIILSSLSDVDMTVVTTQLTQQLASLQLAQQSYLKIQETFHQLLNI